jgi:glycosyltransferase involved in cell wall biosynthesis
MPCLSIVIPAYNEAEFIGTLLKRVLATATEPLGFQKEVIVVNDGSTDRTDEIVRSFSGVKCITQVPNQGKGKAVRRGIQEATGDYILIQDADLEYDPNDYVSLIEALRPGSVIYGSRVLGQLCRQSRPSLLPGKHPNQGIGPWLAGLVLSVWTWLLYRQWISDTLTAYKLYPADLVKTMVLRTSGFETDHEITAKLIKQRRRIGEVPIAYFPRGREEGKKIKASDGLIAMWTLLRFRFVN